jgi:hypothetical protein
MNAPKTPPNNHDVDRIHQGNARFDIKNILCPATRELLEALECIAPEWTKRPQE